jgi:hypothetical protein
VADELVSLCECRDIVEAQMIRASFAARGVFAHIDGEHHRSIMGPAISVIALRIMVRSSQLDLARELAREIIPDLAMPDQDEDDEQPGAEHSPLRRPPAEDLVAYRDDEDVAARQDEDEPYLPRKKSIVVALVVFCLGFAVGTLHFYAERPSQGFALLAVTVFAIVTIILGQPLGMSLLAMVWIVDAGHGIWLLRQHNRAIEELAKPKILLN